MQWLSLVPSCFVCLAYLLIPGLAIGWLLGIRRLALVATAPPLSVTVIAGSAIIADRLNLDWGILPVALVLAVLSVFAGAFGWLVSRWQRNHARQPKNLPITGQPVANSQLQPWLITALSLALAAILATWQLVRMLPSPNSFSETFDNIFHMNLVRWILDNHTGSSFVVSSMVAGDASPWFYPSAWHDLVSVVMLTMGATDIAVPTNATIWLVMTIVWPLGCLFLVQQILPQASLLVRLGAGVLTSSFAAFPSLLMVWGVLYPNFLAFAFLPSLVALGATILRLTPPIAPTAILVVTVLACLPGLFLAHPNGLLSYIAILSPLGLTWCLRGVRESWQASRTQVYLYALATIAALVIFATIWLFGRGVPTWQPTNSIETTVGEVILASPMWVGPFWLLGLLICAGLVALMTCPEYRWWIGPTAVIVALWGAASAMPAGTIRNVLVSGYYNDPFRLGALLPIALLPVTLFGLNNITSAVNARINQFSLRTRTWLKPLAAAACLLIIVVGVQLTRSMTHQVEWVRATYTVDDSPLVNRDELAVIDQLPAIVPPGVRVATDPWDGSSMAYALIGVPTTTTHVYYNLTVNLEIINESLNQAAVSPGQICPALKELNVGYVLDFGRAEVSGGDHPYPGFDNLATAPGFVAVASEGDAVLYRIDACNGR